MIKAFAIGLVLAGSLAGCNDDTCDPNAPNTICTVVGSSKRQGRSGDGGPATEALLNIPIDTTMSPQGELWVVDFNNYVVRAVDAEGTIRTVVGTGELGDSPTQDGLTEIPALSASNNHTATMFFAGNYLYLAAWHESKVKRVRLGDMMMENFAGRGVRAHYDGDGADALLAAFELPTSIASDPAGNIVIMDSGNQVVRLVDRNTNIIRTIVGTCIADLYQPCAASEQPTLCAGTHKLACGDHAVTCEPPNNECNPAFAGDGGPAVDARLGEPLGFQSADPSGHILYDRAGNLLIADTANNRIRKVDTAGIITTIAGSGSEGYAGDDGPATAAQLNHPVDLTIADDGTVYFTDVDNSCVRKIDPAGTISRVAGQCSPNPNDWGFAGDGGPPLEAKMDRPYGIDLAGNKLYVTDSYNNRVRVVNLP